MKRMREAIKWFFTSGGEEISETEYYGIIAMLAIMIPLVIDATIRLLQLKEITG